MQAFWSHNRRLPEIIGVFTAIVVVVELLCYGVPVWQLAASSLNDPIPPAQTSRIRQVNASDFVDLATYGDTSVQLPQLVNELLVERRATQRSFRASARTVLPNYGIQYDLGRGMYSFLGTTPWNQVDAADGSKYMFLIVGIEPNGCGRTGTFSLLARVKPEGLLDESFGNQGIASITGSFTYDGTTLALDSQGNPVIANYWDGGFGVFRVSDQSGEIAKSYGGMNVIPALSGKEDWLKPRRDLRALALDSQDRAIVALAYQDRDAVSLYRLDTNGQIDRSFGEAGEIVVHDTGIQVVTQLEVRSDEVRLIGTKNGQPATYDVPLKRHEGGG